MTVFIGDIHGDMAFWLNEAIIWSKCEPAMKSVQVGDFGVGFVPIPENVPKGQRFIRGNHDHPELCKSVPFWIPDGTVEGDTMYVGGASSSDKLDRVENVDWWRAEELSIPELNAIIDLYAETKPRIMVTHTCPSSIVEDHFSFQVSKLDRTSQALQAMWEIHQPEHWVFGHFHRGLRRKVKQTRFVCLDVNCYETIL